MPGKKGAAHSLVYGGLFALASLGWVGPALAADAPAGTANPASAPDAAIAARLRERTSGALRKFYAGQDYRPLWISRGKVGPEAQTLLSYLESARLDGLKPSRYPVEKLRERLAATRGGGAEALARAEIDLSDAFARYVRDMRKPGKVRMEYAERGLKPGKLGAETVLRAAALPKSFGDYMASMGWMSTHYVTIRKLLRQSADRGDSAELQHRIRLNLERARLLPSPAVRHIVVDAASARLWYYQAGKEQGSMKVVVGTNETRTPMMAGALNYAILNPYWNIPDYLVRDNVAPKVLAGRTFKSLNMEVLSDWSASAKKVDPATVDWHAVAAGKQMVRVRELPGPKNSMGRVKFVFPNDEGIYLHDTPNRDLFARADRHLSNGCIRLERAVELGKWLMGKPVATKSKQPEQAIALTVPVPVYLTYLTVAPSKKGVEVLDDVYGMD